MKLFVYRKGYRTWGLRQKSVKLWIRELKQKHIFIINLKMQNNGFLVMRIVLLFQLYYFSKTEYFKFKFKFNSNTHSIHASFSRRGNFCLNYRIFWQMKNLHARPLFSHYINWMFVCVAATEAIRADNALLFLVHVFFLFIFCLNLFQQYFICCFGISYTKKKYEKDKYLVLFRLV